MSIKRMSAGDGYRYLMRSVVANDVMRDMSVALTRYYAESGTPPGRWLGSGLAGLDDGRSLPAGSVAGEEQMFRLFGMGCDPVTGQPLGSRPYRIAASGRAPVAGFDLTFSVPKSVSVWWALADAGTQQQIVAAHHAALDVCVRFLEAEVAATRIGVNGVAQAEVRGLIAAGFDHWDSRAGDPQLHTHLVIANRVQGLDGKWRTLDSRALFHAVVAVSETYNGLLADELTRRLGVTWEPRTRRHSRVPAWEIADVPAPLIEEFSQRAHDIEAEKDRLVGDFRTAHGRAPTNTEMLRLRQQATLATRPDKQHTSLGELMDGWRDRASHVLGMDAAAWAKGVGVDAPMPALTRGTLRETQARELADNVLATVETKRSTWSRWNLHAEAARQLMGHRFGTPEARLAATAQLADLAVAESTLLTPPPLAPTPAAFLRGDGTSMFAHRHAEQYTSRALLDAEARLLDAARDTTAPRLTTDQVDESLAVPPPGRRYRLGSGQAAAARAILTSGRALDLLVGPAGTGKTVTLAALRAAWETRHGPDSVVGLAPSASAAEVLAGELDIASENTAKWLTEHAREPDRLTQIDHARTLLHRVPLANVPLRRRLHAQITELDAAVERWRLHPGQMVILDEASLADTRTLDRLTAQARAAGAKVLLVGDWAQLSAVDAGGAFAMLVHDRPDPPELRAIRRFTEPWERGASRRLRVGDAAAIEDYQSHQRVRAGDSAAMLDAAYQAWLGDESAGRRSLMLAADRATVSQLNLRARNDLIAAGRVEPNGVALADGTQAGVGDRIVTRHNDRLLTTGAGFVKNGDRWTVTAVHPDGALTVRRPTGQATITLPADYVARHVDLGYATTAWRAQGATVDTAHAVITGPAMTRETLYVAMTRARHSNTGYVITDQPTDLCADDPRTEPAARDVLAAILARTGADTAAHQTMRTQQDRAASIAQLAAEYDTIAATAQAPRWQRAFAAAGLTREQITAIEDSPSYGALAAVLRRADTAQLPIDTALRDLVQQRTLTDADDLAAVLHDRVTRWLDKHAPTPDVTVVPEARGVADAEAAKALTERENLIEQRAQAVLDCTLAADEPWTRRLGPPPTDPIRRETWLRAALTVAAFHDRYADGSRRPAPEDVAIARRALARAYAESRVPDRPAPGTDRAIQL